MVASLTAKCIRHQLAPRADTGVAAKRSLPPNQLNATMCSTISARTKDHVGRGHAMSVKQWFGVVLPFAMVGSAAGREPDVHVDLAASNAIPRFFAIPFVFE